MISIQTYTYKSVVKNFTIFAPVKHGTRWLSTTDYSFKDVLFEHRTTTEKISLKQALINTLFEEGDNPFGNSKIKLKKFKRKLKIDNPVFVYRDPYECFIKAILTALDTKLHKWNGEPNTLDIMMTSNGHFSPTLWRDILDVLELLDSDVIEFVELRQLSKYVMINTLKHNPYEFDNYSFEKNIVGGYTKDEIVELCNEYHPQLWSNFMVQIEQEKLALNTLLEKFKWTP